MSRRMTTCHGAGNPVTTEHAHTVSTASPPTPAGIVWEGCDCGAVRRLVRGVVDVDGWHACSLCSSFLVKPEASDGPL